MKKVIFDTDIGVDDAMALLFLHYAKEVELLAVVTGFGNASIEDTTRNALYVKELFDIAAPVYRGAAEPSGARVGEGYPDFVHGGNGLGGIEFADPASREESTPGAEAIVDLVNSMPGELSIVAVGRMTNLAAALTLCPELPKLVKEVIVMGGAFGFNGHRGNVTPVAEANIAGDPLAADAVFTSGLPLTIVGLDVTKQSVATSKYFDALRESAGRAGDFIHRIAAHYLDFHERATGVRACPVHDSSAVAYLLAPQLFSVREVSVRVVTDGIAMGQTTFRDLNERYGIPHWDGLPSVNICTDVRADELLAFYAKTLSVAA